MWWQILQVRTEIFILITQFFSTRAAQEDSRQAGRMYSNSWFSQRRMVKGEAISTAAQCRKLLIRWKYWCEAQNMGMIPSGIKPWCSEVFPSPQAASSSYTKRDLLLQSVSMFSIKWKFALYKSHPKLLSANAGSTALHALMWEFSAVPQTVRHGCSKFLPLHHTQVHLRQQPKMHQLSVIFHIPKDLQVC